MSEREKLKQIIYRLPEYKISYTTNLLLSIEKTDIEEVEPDEWNLKMISDAKEQNDGSSVSLEDLLKREGLTYADL